MTTFAQLGPPNPDPRSRALKKLLPRHDQFYDPPEGWRYGFPKLYLPLHQRENIADTLKRDGYPAKLAKKASKHCRFWFAPKVGAEKESTE